VTKRQVLDGRKLALIGAITVSWAMLEYSLQRIIWALLALNSARGRLVTNNVSIAGKVDIVRKLLGTSRSGLANEIRLSLKAIDGLSKSRNDIVHGNWVWHHNTGELMLVSTRRPPRKDRDKNYILADEYEYIPMPDRALEDLNKTILEVLSELVTAAEYLEATQKEGIST
jgi:hypothetical protein